MGSHLVLGMIWNNPHMDANGQQLGMVHHREPARHAQSVLPSMSWDYLRWVYSCAASLKHCNPIVISPLHPNHAGPNHPNPLSQSQGARIGVAAKIVHTNGRVDLWAWIDTSAPLGDRGCGCPSCLCQVINPPFPELPTTPHLVQTAP